MSMLRMNLTLIDDTDVSQAYAGYLRELREPPPPPPPKLSRAAIGRAKLCTCGYHVKKFELTGQVSFRQLLLLWQTLDSLDRLYQTYSNLNTKSAAAIPSSIDDGAKR